MNQTANQCILKEATFEMRYSMMSQYNWFHYPICTVNYLNHKQGTLMACVYTVTLIKILHEQHALSWYVGLIMFAIPVK